MKHHLGYILTAYLSLFCFGLLENTRGPVYPSILEEFRLNTTQGSLFFALSTIAYIPMILLGKWWLKRFGELNSQRFFLGLIAFGFFGMGISGFSEGGFSLLLFFSVLFGLGLGGTMVTTNVLVAFGISDKGSKRIFSGLHSMYGISSILAPLTFTVFIALKYDWRYLFITLSVIPLLTLISTLKTKQIRHRHSVSSKPASTNLNKRLLIGFVISFYVAAEIAVSSRLVLFCRRRFDFNAETASIYLSLFFVLLFLGRLIFSIIKIESSTFKLMILSNFISIVLIVLGLSFHPVLISLSGLSMSYYFPYGMDWIKIRFPQNTGYMMTSVMTSIAVILVIMHWGVGFVTDIGGVLAGMSIAPIFLLISTIIMISLRKEFVSAA